MLSKTNVAFLWHMHQPCYRDPIKGFYTMPWVRLHSTKAYYDMAVLAGKYPEMKVTINLVPSLLEQIEDYVGGGAEDFELMLSKKDPVDITTEEKEAILSRFFQANLETMIKPIPRYIELLNYRGINGTQTDINNALKKFAAQDYLDLQVLFNLSWFGHFAREENPEIKKLFRKGRLFSIEDRTLVLEKQMEVMAGLIPLHRKIWDSGAADLSTTPFYHPILPLLCDTSIARTGMPGCLLPKTRFMHPEDAKKQVEDGIDYFERLFSKKPAGMWPSEGSVSPEALEIIAGAGIKWAATDEEILARSAKNYEKNRDLYRPWKAHGLSVFFRDHHISDQIGFVYSRNPADLAVDDFISRLKNIPGPKQSSPLVSIILDGENPWEYYPNSGKDFLETLYSRIVSDKDITPVSFTDYLAENPPKGEISSIFPGSWINGCYDTWIGDEEEVNGWDALKNARNALIKEGGALSAEENAEAWQAIYRAEGSDWFWWYGDDHSSPNDPEFDRLFRSQLERVYNILGIKAPSEVTEPILLKQNVTADVEPTGFVTPVIDGKVTTFYEWLSSGWIPTAGPAGAMSGNEPFLSGIYYGFDLSSLYFRFDFFGKPDEIDFSRWKISVIVENEGKYRIDYRLSDPGSYTLFRQLSDKWVRRLRRSDAAASKVIEMGIPFEDMTLESGDKVGFFVIVYDNDIERERWPVAGRIALTVPGPDFQPLMWQL